MSNIKKIWKFGGGTSDKIVNYIGMSFHDTKTVHIEDNMIYSVKKQVKNYFKNELKNSKETT